MAMNLASCGHERGHRQAEKQRQHRSMGMPILCKAAKRNNADECGRHVSRKYCSRLTWSVLWSADERENVSNPNAGASPEILATAIQYSKQLQASAELVALAEGPQGEEQLDTDYEAICQNLARATST